MFYVFSTGSVSKVLGQLIYVTRVVCTFGKKTVLFFVD